MIPPALWRCKKPAMPANRNILRIPPLLGLLAALILLGCAEDDRPLPSARANQQASGAINPSDGEAPNKSEQIAVNGFLWRATLDTLVFMPLASADPFGGVIITDWYSPPETPAERFKVNVYILDRRLRADGLRVAVFRQRRDGATWIDTAVNAETALNLENAILNRARQMRMEFVEAN